MAHPIIFFKLALLGGTAIKAALFTKAVALPAAAATAKAATTGAVGAKLTLASVGTAKAATASALGAKATTATLVSAKTAGVGAGAKATALGAAGAHAHSCQDALTSVGGICHDIVTDEDVRRSCQDGLTKVFPQMVPAGPPGGGGGGTIVGGVMGGSGGGGPGGLPVPPINPGGSPPSDDVVFHCITKCREGFSNVQMGASLAAASIASFVAGRASRGPADDRRH